jgi:chromate transporter
VVAGACFITPAALITAVFAWAYVRFGALPETQGLLLGVKPAVLAVVAVMVWRLGRAAVKDFRLALVGAAVAAAFLGGASEVLALFGGGLSGMAWLRLGRPTAAPPASGALSLAKAPALSAGPAAALATAGAAAVAPWQLGLFFLKVGALLYGSGYVLLAFLEGGLVRERGWLTQQQLLDAVAVGQFTPSPLFNTATFVGYVVMAQRG